MKMLTIRQPWASLIAVGVKTIETRPFSTTYRGPLAVHAGKAKPEPMNLGGEFGIDVLQHHVCNSAVEWGGVTLRPGDWYAYQRPNPPGKVDTVWPLQLGAVVAAADLVDVVPITDRLGTSVYDYSARWLLAMRGRDRLTIVQRSDERDVTDQLPFGDFTPGRYAWLLDNVRAVEPIPAKGHQGLRDAPRDVWQLLTHGVQP